MAARLVTTPGGEKIVFLGLADYKTLLEENARLRRQASLPVDRAVLHRYSGEPVSPTEGFIIMSLARLELVPTQELLRVLGTSKDSLRVSLSRVRKIIAPVTIYNAHGRGYYVNADDRQTLKQGLGLI